MCADTVDTFKNRLDKFWQDQEVIFNWKADIIAGSRSQVSAVLDLLLNYDIVLSRSGHRGL